MLTSLICLSLCGSTQGLPAQSGERPGYNPYNNTAVSITLNGINVLRAGETEGDEPYLLVYEYGVKIPVIKGVPQKPVPLALRLVGKGSFDGIRSGYDWAKPHNIVSFRGFNTSFLRQKDAWVLFGLAVFGFDHDEYNETQLSELKRRATGKVRAALERTLASDPKSLTDVSVAVGAMTVNGFFPDELRPITDMFKLKADNIVGSRSVILLSKPVGVSRGVPDDLLRDRGIGIPPHGKSGISIEFKRPTNSFIANEASYRGEMRFTGLIIRHR